MKTSGGKMKAIVKATKEPGSLKLVNMKIPIPSPNQVLVKIKAASICGTDISILENRYIGRKEVPIPLVLGHEGAGIINSLGSEVKGLSIGDRVAIEPLIGCGHCYQCRNGFENMCADWDHLGITCDGTFAEYISVPMNKVHKISDSIEFKEAALLEPLGLVVRSLEQSKIMLGETVVILGPGAIGMMHLLAYKSAGASKVIIIGLDQDKKRFEIASKIGADHIINISKQDALKTIMDLTDNRGADIVVETANSPKATTMTFDLAAPRGRIVLLGLYPEAIFYPVKLLRKGLTVYGDVAVLPRQFMRALNWIETGKVNLNSIIRTFSLDEASQAFEAVRHQEVAKAVFEL